MDRVGGTASADNTRPRVLFVTDQWGYGPTTIALAIAAELGGRAERWYAGEGAGFHLARRASFERFIGTDTMAMHTTPHLDEAVRNSDLLVSVMNVPAAQLAAQCHVPCIYVDSLLWMWEEPPVPPSVARQFVEWFPGVEERVSEWAARLPPTELVEPMIAPIAQARSHERSGVLVNFGGLQSGQIEHETLVRYAVSMTECVLEALEAWPSNIVVSAGPHVQPELRALKGRLSRSDVEFCDLSHSEYLAQLDRSRLLISAPGMHAMYEAFKRDMPCLFLPSQSLSQVLAVVKLRQAGAASPLDWDRLSSIRGWPPTSEALACRAIAKSVRAFPADEKARRTLVDHLRASLSNQALDGIAGRQGRFFKRFDDSGAVRVARYVMQLVTA